MQLDSRGFTYHFFRVHFRQNWPISLYQWAWIYQWFHLHWDAFNWSSQPDGLGCCAQHCCGYCQGSCSSRKSWSTTNTEDEGYHCFIFVVLACRDAWACYCGIKIANTLFHEKLLWKCRSLIFWGLAQQSFWVDCLEDQRVVTARLIWIWRELALQYFWEDCLEE